MTIRVLIAADQPIVRAGFRALLDAEADLDVAGEAADGREAVALAHELRPHLVLMDIRMLELDGLEATRQITADPWLTETRVLVLTTFEPDEYVFGALRAGASGFLLKSGDPSELLAAIRLVAAGESLLAPSAPHRGVHRTA
jgi:DNA-binding NarL/FixJ family response regulator